MNYFSGDEILRVLNYVTRKKKGYKNVQMQIATSTSTSTIPFINNTIKKALFF